jgi:putative nucleotidyltransferase with HDIG domain
MVSVLFVDDEPSVLSALKRGFRGLSQNTFFAGSALEGLALLEQHPIGVVVSDNNMPEIGGIEFLALVRTRYPDVCRIMLTGKPDLQVAMDAINRCSTSRFITKPWKTEELRNIVEEAIDEYRIVRAMRTGQESVYRALAHTVELKDPYTKGHCDRVADFALQLGVALNLSEKMLEHIRHGSILHDCGKIAVPGAFLNKPGRLNEEELESIKHHPVKGGEVARQANLPKEVINIILYHHERYQGGGYPEGLIGDAIPLEAQIVALADVYDALVSTRPYREAMPHAEAIAIMETAMSGHFDVTLLKSFIRSIECAVEKENCSDRCGL